MSLISLTCLHYLTQTSTSTSNCFYKISTYSLLVLRELHWIDENYVKANKIQEINSPKTRL